MGPQPPPHSGGAVHHVDSSAARSAASSGATNEPERCLDAGVGDVTFRCGQEELGFDDRGVFLGSGDLSRAGRQRLEDVARLLEQRQDILMLRVEVYARAPGTASVSRVQRREARTQSQARADAFFLELWKGQGVWAERLDAVGYGYDLGPVQRASVKRTRGRRWPVVLRVVQRAR